MASDVKKRVVGVVTKQVRETITPGIAREAATAMAQAYLREMQDRTVAGYDNQSRRLKRLKRSTIRAKERKIRKARGRFRAEKATDIARETGQTLRDAQVTGITARVERGNIVCGWTLTFRTQRSANVAAYLAKGGRPITGLCPQSTARGRAERKRIMAIGAGVIRTRARQKGIIIDTEI